jgi:hypothetical protein
MSSISLVTLPNLATSTPTRRRLRRMVPEREDGQYFNHAAWNDQDNADSCHRGVDGEEVQDEGFNLANARRRSNSSSYTAGLKDFKTKFEQVEQEPVFEEGIHGAGEEDEELPETRRVNTESSDGSIDEDDKAKSV